MGLVEPDNSFHPAEYMRCKKNEKFPISSAHVERNKRALGSNPGNKLPFLSDSKTIVVVVAVVGIHKARGGGRVFIR